MILSWPSCKHVTEKGITDWINQVDKIDHLTQYLELQLAGAKIGGKVYKATEDIPH